MLWLLYGNSEVPVDEKEKAKRKAERKAKREARAVDRRARRTDMRAAMKVAIGEWRQDHKIDPDEVPAIKQAAGQVLLAAGRVGVDALDGDLEKKNLRKLREEAVAFIVVVSAALED